MLRSAATPYAPGRKKKQMNDLQLEMNAALGDANACRCALVAHADRPPLTRGIRLFKD